MAPGLNGRQTGTVPKNKSRSGVPQSQRLACEPFIQLPLLEWEQMSGGGHKSQSKKNSCSSRSETEADSLRHELGRSRSSTMTSVNGNGEGCSQESFCNRTNVPDRKQVTNKLSQIQTYIQQTAALMSTLNASDSPVSQNQYKKLSVMLEELKDSEMKLSALLRKMSSAESRFDSLMLESEESKGNNSVEAEEEEELTKKSRESKKKLEVLQKRKQDLLKLQEKAKKQLQEAQAKQSRLVAQASSLNQELNANKIMDLNVQQLSQRLKTMQEMYNTRNQICDNLSESRRKPKAKLKQPEEEDQAETSDAETDIQLVANKMEELDEMKAQLGQIQKIMASISSMQNSESTAQVNESGDDSKEVNRGSQNSSFTEGMQNGEDGNNNVMKLEQAKSKLNHLTELLEILQSAQNSTGLSPSYMQLVSNMMNDEANSCTESPSPVSSEKSPQRNGEEYSVETMKVMTKELEETTAAMKEERDRLLAARQELQDIAKRLPLNKPETEGVSPDCDSECEPPSLKPASLDAFTRENLNELTEPEQSSNCNDSNPYVVRPALSRNRQRGMWNSSSPGSNCTTQERRSKNESLYRGSNQSSLGGSRAPGRDHPHWCPSPSVSCCNERPGALTESQQQLEMSANLCEVMLAESLQPGGIRPNDISLPQMFTQHQLLTRTVAQCSQLLWLQQKQIIELRNAFMLQCGSFPSQPLQPIAPTQSQLNPPAARNPFSMGPTVLNARQIPPTHHHHHHHHQQQQQQQNFPHPLYQNLKANTGDLHGVQPQQEFPEHQFLPQQGSQQPLHMADGFGCDIRPGNFSRYNPSGSNVNQNLHQNLSSGFNNRGPNGINSVVSEDSGALNNQVPPGNRANNYWDNFRSYSRQNLLSNTKSNEDFQQSRRCSGTFSQDRSPRDLVPSSAQNNHSTSATSQQSSFAHGNCELLSNDQFLLPPSQNARTGHQHSHATRPCPPEAQPHQRNAAKNESRHQDNESRNLNAAAKNESSGGGRTRNPDSGADIRSVRNEVSQSFRNTDNLNSSRNFMQLERDVDNEEAAQGNNKKRLERSRCRNDGLGNLNNRPYHNTSLWESVYSEVSTFIRANESRPHFLLQLFRDLQQITTDSLRQRTLVTVQETLTANNLIDRTSNPPSAGPATAAGGNVNIIDNRNNIRENRSNLNRNQPEDPSRIDELFCHLRENQNTIRQNIGMTSCLLGGNLENPNISNIRHLASSRNNLDSEGLRDLRTYFEASLCNFGHNSALENPNLSNIRENLTRRGGSGGISDVDSSQPKNVYLSIYDNAAEVRRRNQEPPAGPEFGTGFRNFQLENDYVGDVSGNGHYELDNGFERGQFRQESRGFPVADDGGGDDFARSRQFPGSGNDSGIDINFNNDERKRGFAEGDMNVNEGAAKAKKKGVGDAEAAGAAAWHRNAGTDASFDSSLKHCPFIPLCDISFFHNWTFQQSDNGDLAEADQSRNDDTSAGQIARDPAALFAPDQNRQSSAGDNFSSQNVPEADRNFDEPKSRGAAEDLYAAEPEGSFTFSDPEGIPGKNDTSEGCYHQVNPSTSADSTVAKSATKHRKRVDDGGADRETPPKNKFRGGSSAAVQGKCSGSVEDVEGGKGEAESMAGDSAAEERHSGRCSSFQTALEKSGAEAEKGNTSPEAESDWECGSGLDQVPTRLNESEADLKGETGEEDSPGEM